MIAAVFDLDRTLLPGTTAERIFLRRLIRYRQLQTRALLETVRFVFREGVREIGLRIRSERPYLTGMHQAVLSLHGQQCAIEEIRPALSKHGIDRLGEHQKMQHRTVLLSGSLPYVVEPLASDLGIDDVICSQMHVRDGRLTGGLAGLHPYGEAKATLMATHAAGLDIDLAKSCCYADHHSDVPLLEMFGYPVCVNPSGELRRIAQNRGWQIEQFD